MRPFWCLTLVGLLFCGNVRAAELVGVPGSSTRYLSEIDIPVGGKPAKLWLTGTAMRSKVFVNVYALASYVQVGVSVKSADDIVAADCAKRLHLVMERTVDGKDMAEAFRTSIRANHPAPEFDDEVEMLVQHVRGNKASKGDNVYLTHVPGVGLQVSVAGKADFVIKNVAFSKAIWEIYLGKKNLGETIKKGLTSRL